MRTSTTRKGLAPQPWTSKDWWTLGLTILVFCLMAVGFSVAHAAEQNRGAQMLQEADSTKRTICAHATEIRIPCTVFVHGKAPYVAMYLRAEVAAVCSIEADGTFRPYWVDDDVDPTGLCGPVATS